MSPTPGARRPCPRAYAPWLLSLAATLLLAVGAALAQWDLESMLSRAEQRYGELGAAKSRLGDWGRLLEQGGTLDEAAKLRAVNDFFNRSLRFTDDIEIWQQEDYWATPVEALVKGAADCEDYAIAKYVTLRRQRQAAHHLRQGPAPEPGAHGADLVRQPGRRPTGAGQPDRRDPPRFAT